MVKPVSEIRFFVSSLCRVGKGEIRKLGVWYSRKIESPIQASPLDAVSNRALSIIDLSVRKDFDHLFLEMSSKNKKHQKKAKAQVQAQTQPESEEIIEYVDYIGESMLPDIQTLVTKDLSEPYSVFTYRYFVHNWPNLCICVYSRNRKSGERKMIGTLVCKADAEYGYLAGYIAMLTVDSSYRHCGIGSSLVNKGIDRMVESGCVEIILETEVSFSTSA